MIVENFGVEANLFFGRERVEHSADGIHFAGDGFGGPALRAFEDHVLHEMRKAVLFASFAAGTAVKSHADRERTPLAHGLRYDHHAVRELRPLGVSLLVDPTETVRRGRW